MQISFGERQLMFLNVFYVPGMEHNLLLVGQIMRHCPHLHVIFSNHKCYMVNKDTKRTVALGVEDHGLYRLVDIGRKPEHALVAKSASDIFALWHQRYGHLSLPYLS